MTAEASNGVARAVTWADIRPGDVVRLKGDDWTVTAAERNELGTLMVTIQRASRIVGPTAIPANREVERAKIEAEL